MTWRDLPVVEAGVAVVLTGVMLGAALQSQDIPARPVDALFIVAVMVVGAWTVLVRLAPRLALIGATASFFVALALYVPAFSPALALGIPLFAVARAGHLWWGATVLGLVAATGLPFRLIAEGREPIGQAVLDTLFDVSLMAVLLLLGQTLRSRWALREEAELRLRLAEQEQQQRITAERLRIARDLHDVLAHSVTVVGIHAGVAAENLDQDPDRARAAVEQIRTSGREAMADLRSTIALLRAETPTPTDPRPAPGLAQLPDLIEVARAAGLVATLSVHGEPVSVRPAVELAAYRVVQESLTNVLRHAGATTVMVDVRHRRDGVQIEVRDDGAAEGSVNDAGSGLQGMAERIGALSGDLIVGPIGNGEPGFGVRAWLPGRAR
ncbi:MAG: sensor histidine kinase [Pseudonocardiaceae bacterium]